MPAVAIGPVAEAVAYHDAKTPVGSVLRSRQWARIPGQLRNAAQFSAGVESARVLQRIQDGVSDILAHNRNDQGGLTDRSGFIRDLTRLAEDEGLTPQDPAKRGGLEDVTSETRAELIYQMQAGQAYGHADWKSGQSQAALDAAPAQELVRIAEARVPRDWQTRWAEAGAKVGWRGAVKSPMVALKTSPIWEVLSRFGNPWPPYDFGSHMWVEDVAWSEAERLGLVAAGQDVKPIEREFTDRMEASVRDLSPEMRQNLQSIFGPQVDIDNDMVKWKGGQAPAYESDRAYRREISQRAFRGVETAFGRLGLGDLRAESLEGTQGTLRTFEESSRRWGIEISAVAAGRKPVYHEALGWVLKPEALARIESEIQSSLPQGVVAATDGDHLFVYHPDAVSLLADPNRPLWDQIKRHSDDGKWLGYGINAMGRDSLGVVIIDPSGNPVAGFRVSPDKGDLWAAARARDWTDATGLPHSYAIARR